jgi:predicted porin
MKLKWFVVATMATLGSTAYAESSVTLYGVLDSGLLYQSTNAASFNPAAKDLGRLYALKDGGIYSSLWGLKGSEDIGGGYSIKFKLQGAFTSTSGALRLSDTPGVSALFNQESSVGVSGPFGSINAGRQFAPMAYGLAETDVRGGQYFGSILTTWLGMNQSAGWVGTSTNGPLGALYDSNAIVYNSPRFAGVSAALEYAPGGVAGSFQGGTRESAVLRYSNYGLSLAAIYYNGHDTNPGANAVLTGRDNNRFMYAGGEYTTHGFSVSASFANGRDPSRPNVVDLDMYSGGLGYRFSPALKLTSGIYYLEDTNHSANKSLEFAAGLEYSISKATTLYAQAGHVNNEGTATTSLMYGAPVAPHTATTAVDLGLRHNF